jgi:hypothetical protein
MAAISEITVDEVTVDEVTVNEVTISEVDENAQRGTMSTVSAIMITSAIILLCFVIGLVSSAEVKNILTLVIVGTSVWMFVDAWRLDLRTYKSGIAVYPFVLFTAGLVVWPVIFPAYVVVRSKILAEQLPKRTSSARPGSLYMCIAIWCLPVITYLTIKALATSLGMTIALKS